MTSPCQTHNWFHITANLLYNLSYENITFFFCVCVRVCSLLCIRKAEYKSEFLFNEMDASAFVLWQTLKYIWNTEVFWMKNSKMFTSVNCFYWHFRGDWTIWLFQVTTFWVSSFSLPECFLLSPFSITKNICMKAHDPGWMVPPFPHVNQKILVLWERNANT